MSKVIHISDEAHNEAKEFCKDHNLKMSEWVAMLVHNEIVNHQGSSPPNVSSVCALVTKKKYPKLPSAVLLKSTGTEEAPLPNDSLPVYASPPFWAAKAQRS